MEDVTEAMARFRRAACDVWNNALFPGESIFDPIVEESFDRIEMELLRCGPLREAPDIADGYRKGPLKRFVAQIDLTMLAGRSVYLRHTTENGNHTWEALDPGTLAGDTSYAFFDLYDFNHYSIIAYAFARVVSPAGKVHIIPFDACRFLVDQ